MVRVSTPHIGTLDLLGTLWVPHWSQRPGDEYSRLPPDGDSANYTYCNGLKHFEVGFGGVPYYN